tara:strand:- start:84 stop:230 length:147 start_codon:yes stop_codon:yes gene_type:complete
MILENKGRQQTIPKSEIYDVKVRKFSFLKTVGAVVGAFYTLVILLFAN